MLINVLVDSPLLLLYRASVHVLDVRVWECFYTLYRSSDPFWRVWSISVVASSIM